MKYMPQGGSGVVTFGIKGGRAEASAFQDALKLCSIATHVADAKTCVLYPAGTTHRQMSPDELKEAGVLENLVRLSVGIENADDIIDDLAQALG
jgi:O-acetylhomoserine (thiol)-lyase